MSAEVVAPLSHNTRLDGRQKAKSLPTVVYRMNSSGSASFNLDDEEFNEKQGFNTSESELGDSPLDSPSGQSLDIHLRR